MHTPEELLSVFYETCLQSVKQTPANRPPPLAKVQRVKAVAKYSIAAKLGLQEGDLLVKFNHQNGIKADLLHAVALIHHHRYTYYLKASKTWLKLRTNGVPLGVDLEKPVSAIIAEYDADDSQDDLVSLWGREEDQALQDLVFRWRKKGILWLEQRFPKFGAAFLNDVEVLFVGVVLYDAGEHVLGSTYIQRFMQEMDGYTTNFGAIAVYYTGLEYKRLGEVEIGRSFIEDAYDRHSVDRIGCQLGLATDEDEADPWEGEIFPVNYTLPAIDNPGQSEQLEACTLHQDRHQLMIICLLGSYRSNGPYEYFMQAFLSLQRHFGKIFSGLHVVTASEHNHNWLDSENRALDNGLPVSVLYDEGNRVADTLHISSSPNVFFVDKHRRIICHDILTSEVDIWDLVAQRIEVLCSPIEVCKT